MAKAIELCRNGDFIDGKQACSIGSASQLFSSDKPVAGAEEMARKTGGMLLGQ